MSRPPRRIREEKSKPYWLILAVLGAILAIGLGAIIGTFLADRSLTPVRVSPAATAQASPPPTPLPTPTPTVKPTPALAAISPPPLPFTGEPIATEEPRTHGPQP